MKATKSIVIASLIFATSLTARTVNKQDNKVKIENIQKTETVTFKVWGNCGMCKKNIEKSVKIDGVSNASWNKDTKIMTITFDNSKITLEHIQKSIAEVGYDTELFNGNEKAYNKLNACCQYERK